jgi:hypothetical protein
MDGEDGDVRKIKTVLLGEDGMGKHNWGEFFFLIIFFFFSN